MTKKIKSLLILLLGANFTMTAQFGFSHEVGAFVGGVAMQSDFGVRHDFETNAGNTGFAVGEYGEIVKTTNGGTNWEIQKSETTSALN